jgi:hypothetical protein
MTAELELTVLRERRGGAGHVAGFAITDRFVDDHRTRVEVDRGLGPRLDWPEFKALFRHGRARQEGT